MRLVPLEQLRFHEDVDEARGSALTSRLSQDWVLRNPLLATPLPDGTYMILDGAHRALALAHLGLCLCAIQIVKLESTNVRIDSWAHVYSAPAVHLPSLKYPFSWRPVSELALPEGDVQAVVTTDRGSWELQATAASPAECVAALHAVTAAFRGVPRSREVPQMAQFRPLVPSQARLFVRRFSAAELVVLVQSGLRLPAGLTRFVVPGRILHVNIPLQMLEAGHPSESLNRRLDEFLASRISGIRYYDEPVILLEY